MPSTLQAVPPTADAYNVTRIPLPARDDPPDVASGGLAALDALERLFDLRSLARRRVLIIDYDGTLAPVDGDGLPYPGVREALVRIRAQPGTRLVIVGSRPARDMARRLALYPQPEIWGVHGWEHLTPAGQLLRTILPAQARAALDRLRALRPQLEALGARLDDRAAAITVCLHHLAPDDRQAVGRLVADLQAREIGKPLGVMLQAVREGLEMRACGPNKGSVARTVLREEPRDAVAAYLGDDLSDEDAFRAVASFSGRGLGVRVQPSASGPCTDSDSDPQAATPTAAALTLQAPGQLLQFLSSWGASLADAGRYS